MIVLINGSFGVGKTTVAKLLVERLPKGFLYDPELIGFVLKRMPGFVALSGRGTDDFQDVLLWRRLTAKIPLMLHKALSRTVIIPMTFCRLERLNQIRSALKAVSVRHFCLTAPVEVIYERLKKRGVEPSSADGRWIYPRAAKCAETFLAPEFGEHIGTTDKSPGEIAEEIIKKIFVEQKAIID